MNQLNATLFGTGPAMEEEDAKDVRKQVDCSLDFFFEQIERSTKKIIDGKDPHTGLVERNVQYMRRRKHLVSSKQYEIVCIQSEPAPNNLYVAFRNGTNYKLYKLYGKNNYIKSDTAKSTFIVDSNFRVHYIFPQHLLKKKCTIIRKTDITNQLLQVCENAARRVNYIRAKQQ